MKKISIKALAFCLLVFSSCSENFKVAAPYKNITVVYGLLAMSDTAHYIRIQKAFLDDSKSAIVMAQNPDSSYFPQLNVTMRLLNNGNVVNNITLHRVDLATEGYPKDSGAFFPSPNYAYKFNDKLNPDYIYRLVINNPVTGEIDSAETPIISNDPTVFNVPFFNNLSDTISIAHTLPGYNFLLSGTAPPNAAIFQTTIRFFYVDKDVISGKETEKYVDWMLNDETPSQYGVFQFKVSNIEFYSYLRSTIGPPSYGVTRYIDSLNVFITAASPVLYNYSVITSAQLSGITSEEVKPIYTNMIGKNVMGIFASRVTIKYYRIHFNQESLDSLETNPITEIINIHGFQQH